MSDLSSLLSEESDAEARKQDAADIGDASVSSWLLLHAPKLQWTPVFGSPRLSKAWRKSSSRCCCNGPEGAVYMGIILVCLADMAYNLVENFEELEKFRQSVNAPPVLRYVAFAAPLTGVAAAAKITLGRNMMTSEAIEELFTDLHSHMEDADVSACLTQGRQALGWGALLGVLSPLLVGITIVVGTLVYTNLFSICFHYLLPGLLCISIGHGANYAVLFAIDLGIARVDILCKELERISSQAQCQREEKFFTRLMVEYWKLDKQLMKICRSSVSVLAVVVSTSLAGGYCSAMSYFTVDHRLWKVICLAFLSSCAYSSLAVIWPLATLSDRCSSHVSSLYSKPSLLVQLMQCGEMELTCSESDQYLRLVKMVKTCPLGAKIPLIGRITTSDIMAYAKVLGTLLPTLIAYTLSEEEDDNNNASHDVTHTD